MVRITTTSAPYNNMVANRTVVSAAPGKPKVGQDISVGVPSGGSSTNQSLLLTQLEDAKRGKARADKAYKALMAEHKDAQKQLKNVDKRINEALMAQKKLHYEEGPLKTYSSLQRKTLQRAGLGTISNKQSFGLAAITVLLGITAILGRVE